MGGRLALHVAANRPERLLSLTTIGAHAGMAEESREQRRLNDDELAGRIEARGAHEFAEYWGSLPMFKGIERRGPAFRAALDAERRRNSSTGLAASLRGMGAGAMEPVWQLLGRVTCPCLFIAGADDHGYAREARRLAESVPDGRVEIVPRCGHAVHLERPQAFAALLTEQLALAAAAGDAPGTP
jgi:2-succinyl-6-hydroxy-2,4-cyclohexadiene-1-carboxylate synthase